MCEACGRRNSIEDGAISIIGSVISVIGQRRKEMDLSENEQPESDKRDREQRMDVSVRHFPWKIFLSCSDLSFVHDT